MLSSYLKSIEHDLGCMPVYMGKGQKVLMHLHT